MEQRIHPGSPCLKCKYFVNGWCALEVLDRNPNHLFKGTPCGLQQVKENLN